VLEPWADEAVVHSGNAVVNESVMTKARLIEIVGFEMIHSTDHPRVVELLPKRFSVDGERIKRMINAVITGHPKVFFYPHEPLEGEGAKYRAWDHVEVNTWSVPPTATADDVMCDRAYPHGWTVYAASNPLSASEWPHESAAGIAMVGSLVEAGHVNTIVVIDPDGLPWLVGLADSMGEVDVFDK